MERINSPPKTLVYGPLFWHRNLYCRPICPFGLRGYVLHPTQPVRDLRFSSWFELLYDDEYDYLGQMVRYYLPLLIVLVAVAVLPVTWAAENLFSGKTSRRFSGNLRSVCRGLCWVIRRASLPTRRKPLASGSQTDWNRLQAWDALHFPTPPRPIPVVDGAKAFS